MSGGAAPMRSWRRATGERSAMWPSIPAHPARADLAAKHLEGQSEKPQALSNGRDYEVIEPQAPLRRDRGLTRRSTPKRFKGERVTIYDRKAKAGRGKPRPTAMSAGCRTKCAGADRRARTTTGRRAAHL